MAALELTVVPRASADAVGPYRDGVLRVRVTRPPADGEANRAVIGLVARTLGVAPRDVRLVAGTRGRRKRIEVNGIDDAELARRLEAMGAD